MKLTGAVFLTCFCLSSIAFAADEGSAAAPPGAESKMNGYTSLRLDEAGVLDGGFDNGVTIERLSGGARITLLSDDPQLKPLPISAREMKFTWNKETGRISQILIEGKVSIEHPQATVKADRADWDLDKGILTFTGAPVITNAQVPQGMEGQKIVLDFNANKFEVYGGRANEIRLGESIGTTKTEDANLLREQDVTDWPKFLETIRTQAGANQPSPGKQILSLLDAKVQKMLTTTATETLLEDKAALLKQINRVLVNPKLFSRAAWAGITLDADTQALLDQGSKAPTTRLNRGLMAAAFPGLISPVPPEKQ